MCLQKDLFVSRVELVIIANAGAAKFTFEPDATVPTVDISSASFISLASNAASLLIQQGTTASTTNAYMKFDTSSNTIEVGNDGAFTLKRPAHSSGDASAWTIEGQLAGAATNNGGDLSVVAGAGLTSCNGGAMSVTAGAAPPGMSTSTANAGR